MLKPLPVPSCQPQSSGFTLIELMVVIAIVGILLGLGLRNYSTWIANTRIRTTTDSIQNGLSMAKAEAIRRNVKVQFALTTADPVSSNMTAIDSGVSSTGGNWAVRIYQSGGSYTSGDFIQGRSLAEGGGSSVSINSGSAATGCTRVSNLVFTGVGTLSPVPAGQVCFDVSATGGDRPLRVTISTGGAVRMCDPGLSLTTTTMGC